MERAAGKKSLLNRNVVKMQRAENNGMNILYVNVRKKTENTAKAKNKKEWIRKLLERLENKYNIEKCVYVFDNRFYQEWDLPNIMFQARKLELLSNLAVIFRHLRPCATDKRNSFMLVVDSVQWTRKELIAILTEAKNHYEDIHMVLEEDADGIVNYFYKEWGIVVNVLTKGTAQKEWVDSAFFLTGQGTKNVEGYHFENGYVVCENEEGVKRIRKCKCRELEQKQKDLQVQGRLCSGLVYEKDGEEMDYSFAVAAIFENSAIYRKITISNVDIYCLE